jgi:hypothetical protein
MLVSAKYVQNSEGIAIQGENAQGTIRSFFVSDFSLSMLKGLGH